MWLHYFLFMAIIVFYVLQKMLVPYSNRKRILLWGTFLLFLVFIAFRAYTVGNDTPEYYRLFKLIKSQSSISDIAYRRYCCSYWKCCLLLLYWVYLCIIFFAAFYNDYVLQSNLSIRKRIRTCKKICVIRCHKFSHIGGFQCCSLGDF